MYIATLLIILVSILGSSSEYYPHHHHHHHHQPYLPAIENIDYGFFPEYQPKFIEEPTTAQPNIEEGDVYGLLHFLLWFRAIQRLVQPDKHLSNTALNYGSTHYFVDFVDEHFIFWKKPTGTLACIVSGKDIQWLITKMAKLDHYNLDTLFDSILSIQGKYLKPKHYPIFEMIYKVLEKFITRHPRLFVNIKGLLNFADVYGASEFNMDQEKCLISRYLNLQSVDDLIPLSKRYSALVRLGDSVYRPDNPPELQQFAEENGIIFDVSCVDKVSISVEAVFKKAGLRLSRQNSHLLIPLSLSSSGLFAADLKLVGYKQLQSLQHLFFNEGGPRRRPRG